MNANYRKTLADYCERRDKAVLAAVRDNDYEPLKAITAEACAGHKMPSDNLLPVIAHKMCANITSMPDNLKIQSRLWLISHGYSTEVT